MSRPKETNFFAVTTHWQRGHSWYNSLFADHGTARKWYGESSPLYGVWEPALERMRERLRDPALIIILRHPVQRVLSHYKWIWAMGLESRPLLTAIYEDREEDFHPDRPLPDCDGHYTHYRRFSHYSRFCPLMESLFGKDRILYISTEELSSSPQRTLSKCFAFLGVPEILVTTNVRANQTESVRLQRKLGFDKLLSPIPQSLRDRLDPRGRFRARAKTLFGKHSRKPPAITDADKEELNRVLAADITFYNSTFSKSDLSEAKITDAKSKPR